MPITITAETHPAIRAAFREIEFDNSGGHVGTTYPSGFDERGAPVFEPLNLETFEVPDAFAHLVPAAEAGLARLIAEGGEHLSDFCSGEESKIEATVESRGDLADAHRLLNAYFGDWDEEAR